MTTFEESSEYFRQRESGERELAAKASDRQIAEFHRLLAEEYAKLAEDVDAVEAARGATDAHSNQATPRPEPA